MLFLHNPIPYEPVHLLVYLYENVSLFKVFLYDVEVTSYHHGNGSKLYTNVYGVHLNTPRSYDQEELTTSQTESIEKSSTAQQSSRRLIYFDRGVDVCLEIQIRKPCII